MRPLAPPGGGLRADAAGIPADPRLSAVPGFRRLLWPY